MKFHKPNHPTVHFTCDIIQELLYWKTSNPKYSISGVKCIAAILQPSILFHLNSTAPTMPGLIIGCISYKKIGPNTVKMNCLTVDAGIII